MIRFWQTFNLAQSKREYFKLSNVSNFQLLINASFHYKQEIKKFKQKNNVRMREKEEIHYPNQ